MHYSVYSLHSVSFTSTYQTYQFILLYQLKRLILRNIYEYVSKNWKNKHLLFVIEVLSKDDTVALLTIIVSLTVIVIVTTMPGKDYVD